MFRSLRGHDAFVVDAGRGGLPVVLHSGWIGTWEDWLPQVQALSRVGRVIAFDHRGAGRSPVPVTDISFDELVADLLAVADWAGAERCVLGGFSSGAPVVLEAAAREPDRVAGVALMCPVLPEGTEDFEALLAADFDAGVEAFLDLCLPEAADRDVSAVRRWASDVLHQSDSEHAVALLRTVRPSRPLEEIVVDLPGAIVIGDRDPMCGEQALPAWARRLPRASTHVVAGGGHLIAFTEAEAVTSALLGLIDRVR